MNAEALAPTMADIRDDGFHRSPFQVYLLGFATFGLYELYYLIRGRRLAEQRLGLTPTPYWAMLLLLVPIGNLIYYFTSFNLLQKRTEKSGVTPRVPFWVWALLGLPVGLGFGLPIPMLTVLPCIAIAAIHTSVWRAERRDDSTNSATSFGIWELLVIAIGSALNVLFYAHVINVSTGPTLYTPWFPANPHIIAEVSIGVRAALLVAFGLAFALISASKRRLT